MNQHLSLVRKAQKRFKQINQIAFGGCLPKIKIEVKAYVKECDGEFISFYPIKKPYIVIYKDIKDEILLHEMVHYYLYTLHLPLFMLSAKEPQDYRIFIKKYDHTKDFWDTIRAARAKLR